MLPHPLGMVQVLCVCRVSSLLDVVMSTLGDFVLCGRLMTFLLDVMKMDLDKRERCFYGLDGLDYYSNPLRPQ